jgi:DDE superfamily endonuclease
MQMKIAVYLDAPGNTTIDLIGAHTVEIGTTKHEKDRVSVVLCVSSKGDKMDALVIHRSRDKKKINKIILKDVTYDNGKTMRMFISYNPKAYMNDQLMQEWIKIVYNTQAHTQLDENQSASLQHTSVLFCDNCPSHVTPAVKQCMEEQKIRVEFFPANCTPLLQPLDHSLNAMFKLAYEEEWRNWYMRVSGSKRTASGKRKRADQDTINAWIAASLSKITAENIQRSWRHTLNGEKVLEEAKKAQA